MIVVHKVFHKKTIFSEKVHDCSNLALGNQLKYYFLYLCNKYAIVIKKIVVTKNGPLKNCFF